METFPKEELGMATAIFGLGVVFAPTFGPTLGGYITDNYSWPWVFYINIPLGIFAAYMAYTFVGESKYRKAVGPNDWWGIILLVLWVGSLQTVLERGESEDWFQTTYITVLTIVAVVAFIAFIWWELKIDHPVVHLRVLNNGFPVNGYVFYIHTWVWVIWQHIPFSCILSKHFRLYC